jgi:calcineurin-like phosphoesterase family protein
MIHHHNAFNRFYVDYLGETVQYSPDHAPRSRVKHVKNWENQMGERYLQDAKPLEFDRLFMWSDQHFGHRKIIGYSDRPFDDVDQMDEQFVQANNDTVTDDDMVIWGGDVGWGSTTAINEMLARCKGYKILVIGNHDFAKRNLRGLNFDEIHLTYAFERNDINYLVTHYPIEGSLPPGIDINIHGHTHNAVNKYAHCVSMCVEYTDYAPQAFNVFEQQSRSRLLEIAG